MIKRVWLKNTKLTRKDDGTKHRNESYTIGTYLADTGHGADPYFVGPFQLIGTKIRSGWVWTWGRFKGYKDRTPLCLGYRDDLVEPLEITDWPIGVVPKLLKRKE